MACLGLSSMHITGAARVWKAYWGCRALEPACLLAELTEGKEPPCVHERGRYEPEWLAWTAFCAGLTDGKQQLVVHAGGEQWVIPAKDTGGHGLRTGRAEGR